MERCAVAAEGVHKANARAKNADAPRPNGTPLESTNLLFWKGK
jgi:hypothetical protein